MHVGTVHVARCPVATNSPKETKLETCVGAAEIGEAADGIEDVEVNDELVAGTTSDDVELFGDD